MAGSATAKKVRELCDLFNVRDFRSLHDVYMREDQRLFRDGFWDYEEPVSCINVAKEILATADPGLLPEEDRVWWYEILWIWHHHAISAAIWKQDKERARYFASLALAYQMPDHPNRVTRLLWHLVHDRFAEAKRWVYETEMGPDHKTEVEILDEYEKGEDGWAAFKNL